MKEIIGQTINESLITVSMAAVQIFIMIQLTRFAIKKMKVALGLYEPECTHPEWFECECCEYKICKTCGREFE